MAVNLTKEDREEIASLFVGQMTPLLEEREAEVKKSMTGEFDSAIQRHIDGVNGRISEIETKGKRPLRASGATITSLAPQDEEATHAKVAAFKSFVRGGFFRMPREQRELLFQAATEDVEALQHKAQELRGEFKAFGIADDTLGGYFVLPEIIQNEIIKASVLYSPVRDLARVQPTGQNSVEIRVRKTTLSAQWVAENGTRTETLGQSYGKELIPTHEMYAFVLFSRQMLEDEYFSLENDVQADIAEQFGVTEGTAFVTGDGVGKPQGFLTNIPSGNVSAAAGATAITYVDMVKVFHKLKPVYRSSPNCKWTFNQNTLSAIRQIVDTTGRPLFQPFSDSGLSTANPGTILGKPYVEAVDMPDIATGKITVAVGDFNKCYRFIDRVQMSVQRLEELYAASGQVGILVHKRVGGQVVLGEAVAELKQA